MQHRHVIPFGAEIVEPGVRFALWAPSAENVSLVLDGADHPMPKAEGGWRRTTVAEARAGSLYSYRIGDQLVPDPASRYQPQDVKGPSAVVDPGAYRWSDEAWRGRPWEEAVIYEVHVGTATPEGTFAALADKLPDLVALGITAVELMPLNEFQGRRNWGYDGVLPYAPDSSYGSPDDLKALVDRAHGLGLMMFLDVVYNHFGPVGNYLHSYAASFFTERHSTPWGAGLNVDGDDGGPVRDFFVENAVYWVREFRFDGLRFDAVHAILDDGDRHIIAELAERTREAAPNRQIHLILENEHNEPGWLARDERGRPLLHTAQWNDDIHHCWHTLITGESEAYYADFADDPVGRLRRCLSEGFAYQGDVSKHGGKPRGASSGHLPPSAFVAFLQNHDQIGNRAMGDRLTGPAEHMSLARAGLLLTPQIPMLFMGEEWAASTAFQFFVDFSDDPDLSNAVRDGRRREFRHFAAFSDPVNAEKIPDPTLEETFRRSTLDYAERARQPHSGVLEEFRTLLRIRRDTIVPLTSSPYLGASSRIPQDGVVDVVWRYVSGILRFVGNFGQTDLTLDSGEIGRVLWHSPATHDAAGRVTLPPWSGLVSLGDHR
ncbi:malto-oligosyltrehalose trehalohydrolase [uncultured Enterovirga sp.]|uniref:malto-oligosyltrehalose trehalohydrolase n=1 Tax=uncultured Enterovirga sp. TaxID=2026352 RepID=UPI0035CC4805